MSPCKRFASRKDLIRSSARMNPETGVMLLNEPTKQDRKCDRKVFANKERQSLSTGCAKKVKEVWRCNCKRLSQMNHGARAMHMNTEIGALRRLFPQCTPSFSKFYCL